MIKKLPEDLQDHLLSHASYKLIALVVALVLWATILGRRDVILKKEVDLEFLINPHVRLVQPADRKVLIKVQGPRSMLKGFMTDETAITKDLNHLQAGIHQVKISESDLNLPFGIKLVKMEPESLRVQLSEKE